MNRLRFLWRYKRLPISDFEKFLWRGCPDCHGTTMLEGPTGMMCQNIECEKCGSRFNICPNLNYFERIGRGEE